MSNFIDKIAQGVSFDSSRVLGYSESELEKIERLYEIKIVGDLRQFLLEMGRSDGGLIGDDPIVIYDDRIRVRTHIFMQSEMQDEVYRCGYHEFSRGNPFLFSIESETQYYFVRTTSENPEMVYHYDQNDGIVSETGLTFLEYMRKAVMIWGKPSPVICRGELLLV